MAVVQVSDVVVPEIFTAYQVENSLVSTAFFQSGVAVKNGAIQAQLEAGAESFAVPFWHDLPDTEADITNDNPADVSTPQKINAGKQVIRKSFLHASWSEMSLASELSGSSALQRIQSRVQAYWDRQWEFRLISSFLGILASNIANNTGDMVTDTTHNASPNDTFSGTAVIGAALSMGDRLADIKGIAMHSRIYGQALINNEIEFFKPSENGMEISLYKGLAVIVDDSLSPVDGVYTTILFGAGAVGFGASAPRTGYGTEIQRIPAAGNGGGATILHSRFNMAMHPLGYAWNDAAGTVNAIAGESPSLSDLQNGAHWTRVVSQRKSVPLAFLISH